jgi:hypothetical protein
MSLQQGRRINAANAKRRMERHYRYEELLDEIRENKRTRKNIKQR